MNRRRYEAVLLLLAHLVLATACGGDGFHPGVAGTSNSALATGIEAAGVPTGFVRTARPGSDASTLQVEWVTGREPLLLQVRVADAGRSIAVTGRAPCNGWRCFSDREGRVIAWLDPGDGGAPVTAHVGDKTVSGRAVAVDPSGRYFAVQNQSGVQLGEVASTTRSLAAATPMELKAVLSGRQGPILAGVDGGGGQPNVVLERFDASLKPLAVSRLQVDFKRLEIVDYMDDPEKCLVVELRDDPLCSRLWTWSIRGGSLTGGECAADVNWYSR